MSATRKPKSLSEFIAQPAPPSGTPYRVFRLSKSRGSGMGKWQYEKRLHITESEVLALKREGWEPWELRRYPNHWEIEWRSV